MLHCGAAAWALVSIEMSAHQLKMACELWSILMGCRGFWPGSICSRPLYQDINTIPHAMHHQSGISHTVVGRLQARVVVPWKRSSSYLFIYTVISKCSLVATRTWRQQVNNTTPTSLVLPTSRGRGYVIVVVAVAYVRGHLIKFGRNGDLKREKRWSYEDEFFSTHYDAITHTSFELDLTGFFFQYHINRISLAQKRRPGLWESRSESRGSEVCLVELPEELFWRLVRGVFIDPREPDWTQSLSARRVSRERSLVLAQRHHGLGSSHLVSWVEESSSVKEASPIASHPRNPSHFL